MFSNIFYPRNISYQKIEANYFIYWSVLQSNGNGLENGLKNELHISILLKHAYSQ
jgi:hypothetical protein